MLETKKLRQNSAFEVKSQADLEYTTYVCSIEPGHSSGQEGCAANMRSVLMFEGFLGKFEELFSIHEWYVWEVGSRVFKPVLVDEGPPPRKQGTSGKGSHDLHFR